MFSSGFGWTHSLAAWVVGGGAEGGAACETRTTWRMGAQASAVLFSLSRERASTLYGADERDAGGTPAPRASQAARPRRRGAIRARPSRPPERRQRCRSPGRLRLRDRRRRAAPWCLSALVKQARSAAARARRRSPRRPGRPLEREAGPRS